MIAWQWVGETLESEADTYGKYLEETGIKEIKATKGNQGVWLMRRVHEGRAEFVPMSLRLFWLHFLSNFDWPLNNQQFTTHQGRLDFSTLRS